MMEDGDKRGITVADEIRIVVVVVDWFTVHSNAITAATSDSCATL